jgi:uncharacterized membrane protein
MPRPMEPTPEPPESPESSEERADELEARFVATGAIVVAVALMLVLPARVANSPRWVVPAIAILLGVVVLAGSLHWSDPTDPWHRRLRRVSLVLLTVMSLGNVASGARLVVDLARAQGIRDPATLLLTGGAIWLTNVIVFSLWYWELDRGGPVERSRTPWRKDRLSCSFLFPQMDDERYARPDWRPEFFDYCYFSFTNATAFSPTDVMPLTRPAKAGMMLQSALSIVILVLVVARAVNILH